MSFCQIKKSPDTLTVSGDFFVIGAIETIEAIEAIKAIKAIETIETIKTIATITSYSYYKKAISQKKKKATD